MDSSRTAPADRLLLAGFLAAVFLYCLTPVHNGNIFWHLRNGEDILDTGTIRLEDPFTGTFRGSCWIQQEWLAEVFFAGAWRIGGAAALILLKGLVVTASVLLAVMAARKKGASTGTVILVALLWFTVCHARWIARPHVFTLLYFSLYLYLMAGMEERPLWRNLLLFLPVQVLWVNTHAGFVMGPFLLFLPVLDRLGRERAGTMLKGLVLPLSALLASGLHPNGFRSLQYLPSFLSQPLFRESIREWWSPFDPRYQPGLPLSKTAILLILALAVTLAVVLVRRNRIRLSRLAGLAALGVASLFAARNIELLALASVAWISPLPSRQLRRWIPAALIVTAVAVAFLYGVPREVGPPRQLGFDVDWEIYPVDLADFIAEHPALMQATVFNTNEISGYLEYRFGEELPLYMDGRCLLYPEEFFKEYLLLAKSDSTRSLEQLRIHQDRGTELALLDWPDQGISSAWIISRLPGWTPVFWDDLTVAYARKDMLDAAGLGELAMDHVDPLDYGALLSWPLYRIPPSWVPELERAASPPMNMGVAVVLLSAWHLQRGNVSAAEEVVSRLQNDTLSTSMALVLEGRDPGYAEPGQLTTIRVWSLVRSGRTAEAAEAAAGLSDPVLSEALAVWASYTGGECSLRMGHTGLPFIPGAMLANRSTIETDSPEGILVLASAAMTVGMLDSALVILERLDYQGDSLSPWMLGCAALIHASYGDDITAQVLSDSALSYTMSPYTLESRGRIEWMAGRYERAEDFFSLLLDISPGYTVGRNFYADCLWRNGEVDAAMEQYAILVELGGTLPPEAHSRTDAMEMLLADP